MRQCGICKQLSIGFLIGLFVARSAGAQQPEGVVASARQLFLEGMAALDRREFTTAAEFFRRSYELRRSPSALWQLGVAQIGGEQWILARESLSRALEQGQGAWNEQESGALRTQLAQVEARLGRLRLTGNIDQARITVDGERSQRASDDVWLLPGSHQIEASANDRIPERREVLIVAGGISEWHLALAERVEGRLRLSVTPETAMVWVNGALWGAGSAERQLSPGSYLVRAEASGFQRYEQRYQLEPRADRRVDIVLQRNGIPGWVVPVAISGGVVVVGAVVLGIVLGTGVPNLPTTTWGTVMAGTP